MSRAGESGGEVGFYDPTARRESLSNLDVRVNFATVISLAFRLSRGAPEDFLCFSAQVREVV